MYFQRTKTSWQLETPSERVRREHTEFLTYALWSNHPFPRIPLRRVDAGGFDALRLKPRGREVAERWWRRALRFVTDFGD